MNLRRIFAALATSLAAVGALVACSSPGAQSDETPGPGQNTQSDLTSSQSNDALSGDPIAVGLTFIPNVQFSPVYLADFSDVGAPVEIRHHGTDEGLFSALATGDEQLTVASGDEVLQARAQDLDIVSVGAYYHRYPVEVVVPEDSQIRTLADLRDKRVGVPGEFGSSWFGLLAALDEAGLTTDDIEVVSVGFTQAASLVSGEVDAIVAFVNSEGVSLKQMDFPARSIPLDPGTALVGAAIVTTEEFAQGHPEQLSRVVSAITAGTQKAISDPNAALEATEKWDESLSDATTRAGAEAVLLATIPLWEDAEGQASAVQDLQQWEAMGPFLAKLLDEPALVQSAQGAATNEYVD